MAKVLVYTSPARGHLYPITPTLDELRRRGHDVALRTLASQVATMRTRGFDAAPISAAIDRATARSPRPRHHPDVNAEPATARTRFGSSLLG